VNGSGVQDALAERARATLATNDMGSFFRPGPVIYPFQWNWDSALIAIGLARVDAERGRAEVRSLLRGQWDDGMVPHIVFHIVDSDYVPGPELWNSAACPEAPEVPTSGITQPPVLATAVRVLHEAEPDVAFLEEVVPALERWHQWLHDQRGAGDGLVTILHPWEAADNSPRFDSALAALDVGRLAIERKDRRAVDASERPTDIDYARYLYIVDWLQDQHYRPASPTEAPFAYVDLSFNSILAVAENDLAWLWSELEQDGNRADEAARRLREALALRWDEAEAVYVGADGERSETIDELFPLYAGVPQASQARRLYEEALWSPSRFGPSPEAPWPVTSASKSSPAFEPRRYWRGPVWVNVNWFFVRGLERVGMRKEAEELRRLTLELVTRSGFSEYYDPTTGDPLGSESFSWSAALTLDLLFRPPT
jgi:glycogen debranching enzyme